MKPDLSDLLVLIGLIISGTGVWMISPPVALIVVGAIIFLAGIVLARSKGGDKA